MKFKLNREQYIERVKKLKIREMFVFKNSPIYSFIEPFIIGNSELHVIKGYPIFAAPLHVYRESWKSFFLQPIFINLGWYCALILKSTLNLFKTKDKIEKSEILLFSNSRFIDENGANVFFDKISLELKSMDVKRLFFETNNPFSSRKKYLSIYNFLNFKLFFKIISYSGNISRIMKRNRYLIKNIFTDDYSYLKSSFDFSFKILPLQIATYLALTEEILNQFNPKAVLAISEAELFTKAMIINSQKRKIKIFTLQFGPIINDFCDINPTNDLIPDIKFVEGEQAKRNLIDYYDYPSSKIVVTGSPRYDSYVLKLDPNNYNQKLVKRKYGFQENDRIMIFFEQGIFEYIDEVCSMFEEVTKRFNLKILIKMHPHSLDPISANKYQQLQIKNKNIKVISNVNNQEILGISNLAVTWNSTVALEVLLAKVPLILVNLHHSFSDVLSYSEEGSALNAFDKEMFVENVGILLNDSKRINKMLDFQEKSIKMHAFSNDGQAYKRVAKVILNNLK